MYGVRIPGGHWTVRFAVSILALLIFAVIGDASAKSLGLDEIVERYISARGGLESWKNINSLQMSGVLRTGNQGATEVPITLRQLRPHFSRLDIVVNDVEATQVFDGKMGWKLRRVQGQNLVMPYSGDDAISARAWRDIDTSLFEYQHKGIRVSLDGSEKVDGKSTYRLKLLRPDHSEQHVWIDADTFLEIKSDDTLRRRDGSVVTLETHYRNFRKVEGVMIPAELEIHGGKAGGTRTMVFKEITLNPSLDTALFDKPVATDAINTPFVPRATERVGSPHQGP